MRTARGPSPVAITLVLTGALVAVAGGVLLARSASKADISTEPEFANPCMGTKVSLEAAREGATFQLIQPQAPLANASELRSTWECATAPGGVALVYNSGIVVLESLNDLKDPAATWQRMADLYPEFTVREISGIPVSLADPAVDDAIGGADFVVGDVRYTVSGDGTIPLHQLTYVAESLLAEATK